MCYSIFISGNGTNKPGPYRMKNLKAPKKLKNSFCILNLTLLLIIPSTAFCADKFGSTLSQDYPSAKVSAEIKTQPLPKPPSVSAATASNIPQAWTTSAPSQPITNVYTAPVAPDAPNSLDLSGLSGTTPIKGVDMPKRLNIKVPDYERKFQEMMQKKEAEKIKKKKTLWQSIRDELVRYGAFIILGAVIFIMLYAMRKDKNTLGMSPSEETRLEEQKTKTIWDDEF